ncbi:MAG: Mur ligase domain-containing protein [Opitutales bacterium]|nr:Mur ligase domain-containing protein [Opitutales bacterium]
MHIYFMGIGGTAMGNVAILLKSKGHQISGSDQNLYPPMSDKLEENLIEVFSGYDEKRLESLAPDLVVVGNVIGRGNVEAEWLLEKRAYPFISLPQLIGEQLIGNRRSIVITGTHGKTTTTAWITHLLKSHNQKPGHLIAGVLQDESSSVDIGSEKAPFVIEGDEYDSAFFDKRSKFIHYFPTTLIINNIEFDHGDIFRDLQDIQRSFSHVLRLVPQNGHVLINSDDPHLVQWVRDEAHCKVWTVGLDDTANLQITEFTESETGSRFQLILDGDEWTQINWRHPAIYNARNAAMGLLATALQVHPDNPLDFQTTAFETFAGVKRRQQLLFEGQKFKVFEDFAHHPTAVRETVQSYKNRFPEYQIWVAFEPRSNTSRSPAFQEKWAKVFQATNKVMLGAIHRIHLLQPNQRLDTAKIVSELQAQGKDATAFSSNEELFEHLVNSIEKTDTPTLVLILSNGSFDGIAQRTTDFLKTL